MFSSRREREMMAARGRAEETQQLRLHQVRIVEIEGDELDDRLRVLLSIDGEARWRWFPEIVAAANQAATGDGGLVALYRGLRRLVGEAL